MVAHPWCGGVVACWRDVLEWCGGGVIWWRGGVLVWTLGGVVAWWRAPNLGNVLW